MDENKLLADALLSSMTRAYEKYKDKIGYDAEIAGFYYRRNGIALRAVQDLRFRGQTEQQICDVFGLTHDEITLYFEFTEALLN